MGKKFMGYDNASELLTAIGNKIKANQANVLYAINTGVKNALVLNDREESGSGTIKFSAKNGVVTVTGTAGSSTSFFGFDFTGISGRFKLNGCPSGGSDDTYLQRIYTADGSIAKGIDRGSGTSEFTLDPNVTYRWAIRIQGNYAIQNSLVFRPMLYQADTDGSAFQTGALPNYDLTSLEAEDRAALAEVVDSGAKNLADLSTAGTGTRNDVTFTNLGGNRYKINGTPSTYDTYLDIMGSWSTIPSFISENVGKTLVFSTDQEDVYYGVIPIIGGVAQEYISGNKYRPGVFIVPNNLSGLLLRIYVDTNGTYNNVMTELLVCTKAAFDVSQKFVPYRFPIHGVMYDSRSVACSTTQEAYTGISFIASERGVYRITVCAMYSNSQPVGLRIKQRGSPTSTEYTFVYVKGDSNTVTLTATGVMEISSAGGGFTVYAEYSGATYNIFNTLVEKIG